MRGVPLGSRWGLALNSFARGAILTADFHFVPAMWDVFRNIAGQQMIYFWKYAFIPCNIFRWKDTFAVPSHKIEQASLPLELKYEVYFSPL